MVRFPALACLRLTPETALLMIKSNYIQNYWVRAVLVDGVFHGDKIETEHCLAVVIIRVRSLFDRIDTLCKNSFSYSDSKGK